MIKHILIFTPLLLLFSCQKKEVQKPKPDSLLWEISGNGLQAPSYIYGSIHYIPIADSKTPDLLEECFKKTSYALMESNQDEVDSVLRTIPDTIYYLPNYSTYRNYLKPHDYLDFYLFLRDSLKLQSKIITKVIRLKPIFIDRFIIGAYYGKMFSYDKYFYKLARENRKHIIGLDSGDEIIAYLFRYNKILDPAKFWNTTDSSRVKMLRGYYKTVELYKKNIGYKLDSIMKADKDFDLDSVLMHERNSKWLPEIVYNMRKNPVFIVVGARHLGGNDGLLRRLQNLKYTIRPL